MECVLDDYEIIATPGGETRCRGWIRHLKWLTTPIRQVHVLDGGIETVTGTVFLLGTPSPTRWLEALQETRPDMAHLFQSLLEQQHLDEPTVSRNGWIQEEV